VGVRCSLFLFPWMADSYLFASFVTVHR
jgi:hypothetical protein